VKSNYLLANTGCFRRITNEDKSASLHLNYWALLSYT